MDTKLSLRDQADVVMCMKKLGSSSNNKCTVWRRITSNAASVLTLAGLDVTRFLFCTRISGEPGSIPNF